MYDICHYHLQHIYMLSANHYGHDTGSNRSVLEQLVSLSVNRIHTTQAVTTAVHHLKFHSQKSLSHSGYLFTVFRLCLKLLHGVSTLSTYISTRATFFDALWSFLTVFWTFLLVVRGFCVGYAVARASAANECVQLKNGCMTAVPW